MAETVEIRWHGRGGQGAKTASQILAEVLWLTGKYVQAFPEYGAERAGAPMKAFNRISDRQITLHCAVREPDIVVVIDPTILETVHPTEGLKKGGILLVNINKPPAHVRELLGFKEGKVYTVDATTIALEEIGRGIPNTPILGALSKVWSEVPVEEVKRFFREKFSKKLPPDVVEGNIRAIDRGYREVMEG